MSSVNGDCNWFWTKWRFCSESTSLLLCWCKHGSPSVGFSHGMLFLTFSDSDWQPGSWTLPVSQSTKKRTGQTIKHSWLKKTCDGCTTKTHLKMEKISLKIKLGLKNNNNEWYATFQQFLYLYSPPPPPPPPPQPSFIPSNSITLFQKAYQNNDDHPQPSFIPSNSTILFQKAYQNNDDHPQSSFIPSNSNHLVSTGLLKQW